MTFIPISYKTSSIAAVALLCTTLSIAQKRTFGPNYEWSKKIESEKSLITATVTDSEGAIYNVGHTSPSGNMDLDPGASSFPISTTQFIQKIDSNGNFVWGGGYDALVDAGVAGLNGPRVVTTVDDQDNVLIAGTSNGSFDADIRTGQADIYEIDQNKGVFYVLKYNEDGVIQWGSNFANPSALGGTIIENFEINTLKTDRQGNVYVGGYFNGDSADFDPGPDSLFLSSEGGSNAFAVKLDPNGNLKWAISFGGTSGINPEDGDITSNSDQVQDIVIDDTGNVILVGQIGGGVDMDPGMGLGEVFILENSGNYILKLDSNADFRWAGILNTVSSEAARNPKFTIFNIFRNTQNELFVTGSFFGTVDFDPDTAVEELRDHHPAPKETESDMFFLKLTRNGSFEWVQQWGPLKGIGSGVRSNSFMSHQGRDGWFYFAGITFTRSTGFTLIDVTDYNPGPEKAFLNRGLRGYQQFFVSAFDANGDFQWVEGVEATESIRLNTLYSDHKNNLIITGSASGVQALDNISSDTFNLRYLDPDPFFADTVRMVFEDGTDPQFIFKWSRTTCSPATTTYGMDTIAVCDYYVSPSGTIYNRVGTYIDTLPNTLGCDSILTIHLSIVPPTVSREAQKVFACEQYVLENLDTVTQSGLYSYNLSYSNSQDCDSLVVIDVTIAKTSETISITACDSLVSPSGKYIWRRSEQYTDTLQNSLGCDSILLIDLTIEDKKICDLSSSIFTSSLKEAGIQFFPNPSSDRVTIQTPFYEPALIIVSSLDGRIWTQYEHEHTSTFTVTMLPSGSYLVTIQTEKAIWHTQLIKQ